MHNSRMAKAQSVIPVERIVSRIYLIRDEKVMLDRDLAELYGVETGALVRAVKRNSNRFPEDFSFQLSDREFEDLRCQTGTSSQWGGRRYPPYAFTEQGVAMLSSVLRSKRAAEVNVAIVRTFVRLRQVLATHRDLARKVEEHDQKIAVLFDAVQKLLAPPATKKNPIGYIHPKD
jgi:phage regulator Rha-like protein